MRMPVASGTMQLDLELEQLDEQIERAMDAFCRSLEHPRLKGMEENGAEVRRLIARRRKLSGEERAL